MAKFKIRIEKLESVERKTTEYQKIADTGNEKDGKSIYAYVPAIKEMEQETRILECEVESLDIQKVITAIFFQ